MRTVGVVSRGVRCPVIKQGDDLEEIVVKSLLELCIDQYPTIHFNSNDIVAVTESVVARAQGNYCTIDDIAEDVKNKFDNCDELAITFPILSRNRIAICLKGIAKAFKKVYIVLSYPTDEVGNQLFDPKLLFNKRLNPYCDSFNEKEYREMFGYNKHPFTGVDYVSYYKELFNNEGCEVEFLFSNDCCSALRFSDNVLCCDIHTRDYSKEKLIKAGAKKVLTLADIMNAPINGSGYNEQYGLYGSNKSTEDSVKLFPRGAQKFVDSLHQRIVNTLGVDMNVMIYGDGAFKDPVGKIWELADPVVSPAYTERLKGTPNELKLKYLADNDLKNLSGEELTKAMKEKIAAKGNESLVGNMASQGTTPRQLTDLIGSLCDLTSGSGDKGTPIIYIQGYFDNYSNV